MNFAIVRYLIGWMLGIESIFLLLPALTAVIYGEPELPAYLIAAAISLAGAALLCHRKPKNTRFYAREGYVTVALCWLILAVIGALPFVLSREIPFFIDALFETVSGFTTTGATILGDVEALSHASMLWRCLTHWVGGMGVLVFMLIVLPLAGGQTIFLMRAESPGPSVSKMSPHMRDTATILYAIYFGLTVLQMILLLIGGRDLRLARHGRYGRLRQLERFHRALQQRVPPERHHGLYDPVRHQFQRLFSHPHAQIPSGVPHRGDPRLSRRHFRVRRAHRL